MAINITELFTDLGQQINALVVAELHGGTTIPGQVEEFRDRFDGKSLKEQEAIDGLATETALLADDYLSGQFGSLVEKASNHIITQVNLDNPQASESLEAALDELKRQMIGTGTLGSPQHSVARVTVSNAVSAATTNKGDPHLVVSTFRGDGQVEEVSFGESIVVEVDDVSDPATATLSVNGEFSVGDTSVEWPKGSGSSSTLSGVDPRVFGVNLVEGSFETDNDFANFPDGWQLVTGTPGTDMFLTTVEEQTVAISGTPGSGSYVLEYKDTAGRSQRTEPLPFDADGSAVQAALNLLVGLEAVEVTTAGITPNFTHTVVFNGVQGDPSELVSTNSFDQGTIAHATTVPASADSYSGGKAFRVVGDGVTLHALEFPLDPAGFTAFDQLAFSVRLKQSGTPTAGVFKIGLTDGQPFFITDEFGTENSITIDATALGTTYSASGESFRIPRQVPPVMYLRVEFTTALSAGHEVFIDHMGLALMTEIYAGGPKAVMFTGNADLAVGDRFEIQVTTLRDGQFQEWFRRMFLLPEFILPSASQGSETIPDSLIN